MYQIKKFSDCNLNDPFFDSLREDYGSFNDWFMRKGTEGAEAFVSESDDRMEAFVYVKKDDMGPAGDLTDPPFMKIGTLKITSEAEGTRLGEGAIGLALWEWQQSDYNQIYLTVYPKHEKLIGLIERYGFEQTGMKGDELVFSKDKRKIPLDDPDIPWLKMFPYLDSDFTRGVYIPIEAAYHDNMFQYSDLSNTEQHTAPMPVANGITKVFIATPFEHIDYRPRDIALIYRITDSTRDKQYKSVVTSYCTVCAVEWIKRNGEYCTGKSWETFIKSVGNKTVYPIQTLENVIGKRNVCIITLIYNGYFGAGSNVNCKWLKDNGMFGSHPYKVILKPIEVRKILNEGGIDEKFAFIHKSTTCDEHPE